MSEWCYLLAVGDAMDAFFRYVGVDDDYRAAGHSLYTAETHLHHRRETHEGDRRLGRAVDDDPGGARGRRLRRHRRQALHQPRRRGGLRHPVRGHRYGGAYRAMLASDDAAEGPRAFAEERAPRWTGR